jgi:NAD(P)H-hydrate epimerase
MSEAPTVAELDAALVASLLPRRDRDGHKGTFGRVALVAGSLDYAGAALLAGRAALRGGAGLATLWVPASLQPVLAGRVPELITRALPVAGDGGLDPVSAVDAISADPHDALVIGPGLAADRATERLVSRALGTGDVPAVVDAGALAALAAMPGWWRMVGRPCVLTPHPGEFARLEGDVPAGDDARASAAASAARRWGQVVVLKGARTVVAAPGADTVRRSPFAVPLLATAGTGDVLAGLIGALLAQGMRPADAAAAGVFVHASAGSRLSVSLGDAGLLASDLADALPAARAALVDPTAA